MPVQLVFKNCVYFSARLDLTGKRGQRRMDDGLSADTAGVLNTQKNGLPARSISVPSQGTSNRPAPGYFGTIAASDPDEVLRPLYPQAPETGS